MSCRRIRAALALGFFASLSLSVPSGCGDTAATGGGGGGGVSYELRAEGSGEAVDAARFLPTTGSRIGGSMVRAYRFGGEDYVQLTGANESLNWRGWLKVTEAGLVEVGDAENGLYPKARVVLPAQVRADMEWFTSPWGRADDRIVRLGENAAGDGPEFNGETASVSLAGETNTLFGWRASWRRGSDLGVEAGEPWLEGLGPVLDLAGTGIPPTDAVILDEAAPRPEPGPTVSLAPVLEESLVADCYRPTGISVLQREDGDLQVVLSGSGLSNKIMVSEGGGDSVYLPTPIDLCFAVGESGWRDLAGDDCVGPSRVFVRGDGTHVTIPQERVEYRDQFGNILDVKFVPHGALVEQDGALVHVTGERTDACAPGPCGDPEVRFVTYPDGSRPTTPGGWVSQVAPDGRRVFLINGEITTWDSADGFSQRWKGPRVDGYNLRNTADGHELFHVTADGRLREALLRPDGVEYRPLAQLTLPKNHIATAAVRLAGDQFLVFTHTGDKGYRPQLYREPEIGYEGVLEWKLEHVYIKPDFGEAHLWVATVPDSALPHQLPPISQTMRIAPHNRHLELCWPPVYGAGETTGWTLEGHAVHETLWDGERSCLLLVRHPNRVVAVKTPGPYWAHGPVPTAGDVTVATAAAGSDDGWNATTVTDRIHGTELFTAESLRPALGEFLLSGTNPRLSHDPGGGWYYDGDSPSSLNEPDEPPDSAPVWAGAQVSVGRAGVESYWLGSINAEGVYEHVFYLGPHEPRDRFESAGVQGGGVLFQDVVISYWDPYDEQQHEWGRGRTRFISPPALPRPDADWRHEVMLMDRTLCGHIGGDTLYCTDGVEQRELTGVPHVHPRQWWVTDIAPEPSNGICPANFETHDCPNGRVWLLGADAAAPVASLFDPAAMTVMDFPLAEALPDFPTAPIGLRVEVVHPVIRFEDRKTEVNSPIGLVGAATADGPRYWLVRFGPDAPEPLWGPRRLELPDDLPWAAQIAAETLPRLRPAQRRDIPGWDAEAFLAISHILGDVSDYLVNVE